MKLARIEHWRCGEPMSWRKGGGYTYVWVSDDMTEDQLSALCDKAQESYLDTEQEFKKLAPPPAPGYNPTIMLTTPDTKTVGELKAEHEAATKAWKDYQAMVEKSRKPFAYWLELHGNGAVKQFHNERPALQVEISWGHSHGVTLETSPTQIGDYPFGKDEDDDL